jgi:hypothetical protein
MQQSGTLLVSISEKAVLDAASVVGFGELREVNVFPGSEILTSVSARQEAFIRKLRTEKETFFSVLVIHDNVPIQAEISGSAYGLNYIKKIRFS